jgi:hypothetical protein
MEQYNGVVEYHLDLRLYDLATDTYRWVTNSIEEDWYPAISGTKIVYVDEGVSAMDHHKVVLYDLASDVHTDVAAVYRDEYYDPIAGWPVAISGESVVYVARRPDMNGTVRVCRTPLNLVDLTLKNHDAVVTYGDDVAVKGTLKTAGGKGSVGQTVALESSIDGISWSAVESTVTVAGGAFTLHSQPLTTARKLRVRFAGDSTYLAELSRVLVVKPQVRLRTPSAPSSVAVSRNFTTTGHLKPKHFAGTYPVELRFSRKVWTGRSYAYKYYKGVQAMAVDYLTYTMYSVTTSLPYRGAWRVCAYHASDPENAATFSAYEYFKVK